MKFLEKDLEQIIMETPNEILQERGLDVMGVKKNQLRIGNYGILDVLLFERGNIKYDIIPTITILELKKDKVGIGAFLQSINYLKGIQDYLEKRNINSDKFVCNIKLIGKELDTSGSFCFLPDLIGGYEEVTGCLNSLDFYTYEYTIDGLMFKNHSGYELINKGF